MNHPNPFIPQGSVLEHEKRRSRMKLAVFCVLAIGVAGLTAMLIQGCKREQNEETSQTPVDTNQMATIDTNVTPMAASNLTTSVPAVPTNTPMVAPVTPVAPAATPTAGTEYTVIKGDTLGTIAKANHVSIKALEDSNPGIVPTKLKIGQKLNIPAPTAAALAESAPATSSMGGGEAYTVKSGDTMSKIATSHGVSLKALEAANPTVSPSHIKVGQKLTIPAKADTVAPAAPMPAPVAPPAPAPAAPVGTPTGQ